MKKDDSASKLPANPLVENCSGNIVGYRDTLDRVVAVLQLLNEMNLTEGLSSSAESGRYWIQLMLIDAVKCVSDGLDQAGSVD